jgi:hypothetical protein
MVLGSFSGVSSNTAAGGTGTELVQFGLGAFLSVWHVMDTTWVREKRWGETGASPE